MEFYLVEFHKAQINIFYSLSFISNKLFPLFSFHMLMLWHAFGATYWRNTTLQINVSIPSSLGLSNDYNTSSMELSKRINRNCLCDILIGFTLRAFKGGGGVVLNGLRYILYNIGTSVSANCRDHFGGEIWGYSAICLRYISSFYQKQIIFLNISSKDKLADC